jgi:hypothetical protein
LLAKSAAVKPRQPQARSQSFTVETLIEVSSEGAAGLALFGNEANHLALVVESSRARLLRREDAVEQEIAVRPLSAGKSVKLPITTEDGSRFRFAFATGSSEWTEISSGAEGDSLAQWDRVVRVGLRATGIARFDYFTMREGPREVPAAKRSQ